ncbi:MAG: 23S rRNA (uracil(1939)-C(5))-methyltransferase RlmD [Elusimicrobia bacterium]|nr:23S rRNA (uracil(1939)-C(5))-methyltransferase RlmD [Elusimicrobiota bacterium]
MSSKTATSASSNSTTDRGAAKCKHFGSCGGCQLQDKTYEEQLQLKTKRVSELMATVGWTKPIAMRPSPDTWYYRNKMEFSFQDVFPAPPLGQDYLFLGLKRKNRWDKVMNLEECHLLSPESPALLNAVHAWALKENLEPYNLHKQTGFLRHLVVREAKNTKDRMVLLVTNPGKMPAKSFVEAVLKAYPATSILWGVNTKPADVARTEKLDKLHGDDHITEELLGRRFRISPYSFFQTNTKGAGALYSLLREWLKDLQPQRLLDLYCGSGAISLCVSDMAENVLGVEVVDSAVLDARHNAAANKVKNAEFMVAKTEELLPVLAAQNLEVDVVITDPPRCGMHPDAVKALKTLSPGRLLYVSCNPKALAEDIRRLGEYYILERVECVDLFPHTDHVETVAQLRSSVLPG